MQKFVGDKVWRKTHVLSDASNHFNAKLAPPFKGPYDVIKKLSPGIYILDMKENRRTNEAYVSELKKYTEPRRAKGRIKKYSK